MTNKQIIIDVCPYQGECSVSGCKRNDDGCFVRQLFEERDRAENRIVELNKTIHGKEQECKELKYANDCILTTLNVIAEGDKKLRQTLTKIKEIAERGFKHSQCNCGAKADLDLILQKISEVLE